MSYYNLTKILAEKYPDRFATWLLGIPQTNVEILKTELSIEPIRADSLTFLKTLIKKLFQEDIMKESVIYQEIFETGEQQGEQRATLREKILILRQLTKQVGEMPQELRSTVELLSIDQLEVLGEALLDFTNLQDLQNWLKAT
jgi:predicted transposase YdaD